MCVTEIVYTVRCAQKLWFIVKLPVKNIVNRQRRVKNKEYSIKI